MISTNGWQLGTIPVKLSLNNLTIRPKAWILVIEVSFLEEEFIGHLGFMGSRLCDEDESIRHCEGDGGISPQGFARRLFEGKEICLACLINYIRNGHPIYMYVKENPCETV
jgi:hypothetical protein